MATTYDNNGKPTYMYDSIGDVWYAVGAKVDTASSYEWAGTHKFLNTATFDDYVINSKGWNNFLNPAARDAALTSPVRGTICFVRQDAGGSALNQIQSYDGSAWVGSGDIFGVTAGTGLTGGGTEGTVTVSLDTSSVYVVPSQSGASGKYLTSNGSAASWAAITTDPMPQVLMMMGA